MAKMSEKCLRMASIKSSSYGFPSEMSHQKCWELGEKYIEEMGIEIHSDIYGVSFHKLYEKEPIPTAASMMRDAVNIFTGK